MSEESIKRVEDIAGRKWIMGGEPQNLLTDDEIQNLNIRKGTLTDEERTIIESHAAITFKMLSQMPFPKKLKMCPFMQVLIMSVLMAQGIPWG